jgi:hypothetical protein
MTGNTESRKRTPLGVILICLFLLFYGVFWVLTGALAGMVGNGPVVLVSVAVVVGVVLLAYFLYIGSRIAWLIAIASLVLSTLWRMSLVAGGEMDNISNAVVGLVIVLYLLSQHNFYQSAPS